MQQPENMHKLDLFLCDRLFSKGKELSNLRVTRPVSDNHCVFTGIFHHMPHFFQ